MRSFRKFQCCVVRDREGNENQDGLSKQASTPADADPLRRLQRASYTKSCVCFLPQQLAHHLREFP